MTTFEVWAPDHERVRLRALGSRPRDGAGRRRQLAGHRVRRRPGHRLRLPPRRGRHAAARPPLALAARTGCTARAGCTTRWRTSGTTSGWTGRQLAGSVVYELHIGTFTPEGTFAAAVDRLDHLVDLGVDLVEVLPVNAVNGTHNWGYDGVGWYAVHEPYGGPDGFKHFVDACHRRGLGVLLDVVYNHLGPVRGVPAALRAVLQAGPQHLGRAGQPGRPAAPAGSAATSWTTR